MAVIYEIEALKGIIAICACAKFLAAASQVHLEKELTSVFEMGVTRDRPILSWQSPNTAITWANGRQ